MWMKVQSSAMKLVKVFDGDTGKALSSKQIAWSLTARDAHGAAVDASPFGAISTSGKLTTKKVVQKVRLEAVGSLVDNPQVSVTYYIDVHPAVTQLELLEDGRWANGKTVLFNLADTGSKTLTAVLHPEDTLPADVEWSISDRSGAYASYEVEGNTVRIQNPTGKVGTVTFKAVAQDGSKKSASLKVQFGTFAQSVEILLDTAGINSGVTMQLQAKATPVNTTKTGVTWSLKNPEDKNYATLSASGKLTAKDVAGVMSVTIVAVSKDGQARDEYDLAILPRSQDVLILRLAENSRSVTRTTHLVPWEGAGTVLALTAHIGGGLAKAENVTWSSSSTSVATVEDGLVTFLKPGKVKITAEAAGKKEYVTLHAVSLVDTVTITADDSVRRITEDGKTMFAAAAGSSITLEAQVNADAASEKVTWAIVSGGEYAKISSSGTLTAEKDLARRQPVTVRATAADGGGAWAEATVLVCPAAQGVQIYTVENGVRTFSARSQNWWARSNTTLEWDLSFRGNTIPINAEVYPFCGAGDDRNALPFVSLSSSNPKIADFLRDEDGNPVLDGDGNAQLVCHKTGSTTITVTAADGSRQKASFKLTVSRHITDLTLANQVLAAGKSIDLSKLIVIGPEDTTTKDIDWEILDGEGLAYATISSKGVLKAKKVTAQRIVTVQATARDGSGYTTRCYVRIYPAAVTKITIWQDDQEVTGKILTLEKGQSMKLGHMVEPAGACPGVVWSSSDEAVVVVGEKSGLVTALGTGTATLTCTAQDGSRKKAVVKIWVP